jgi:ABC-type lipoprotein release transport system permease subunit
MKTSIFIRAICSQYIRTIFMIVLIGATTFGLTARVFEGLTVQRELNRLEGEYHAIGQLVPLNTWEWGVYDVQNVLEESPLVATVDSVRVIQGVMEGVYSPDYDGGTPYTNQLFVYGTVVTKGQLELEERGQGFVSREFYPYLPYLDIYYFEILVENVEVSLPEYVEEGDTLRFLFVDYRGRQEHIYQQVQVGERYFVGGQYSRNISFLRGMNQLFYIPLTPHLPSDRWSSGQMDLMLIPLDEESTLYFYPVSENEEVRHPHIKEQIEVLRENSHTIFLRPTIDLVANPLATSSLFLLEGRLIDYSDYENENPVAVIRAEFARIRDLNLGDTLTITMREREFATEHILPDNVRGFPIPRIGERMIVADYTQLYGDDEWLFARSFHRLYGNNPYEQKFNLNSFWSPFYDGIVYEGIMFADDRGIDEIIDLEMATGYITDLEIGGDWHKLETLTKDFEIVGIYGTTDPTLNIRSVSYNNVFVPGSLVPVSWSQDVLYRNFSFTLKTPADEELFVFEYQDVVGEMGFWITFIDSGWGSFNAVASPIRAGILAGIILFLILVVVVFRLITFLFFLARRKEYAIMRALGVEKRKALKSLLSITSFLGVIGILIGSILAWHFAMGRAERLLLGVEGATFNPLPLVWLFGVIGLAIALFFFFTTMEIFKLRRISELELLQGNPIEGGARRVTKRKRAAQLKKSLLSAVEDSLDVGSVDGKEVVLTIPSLEKVTIKPSENPVALSRFLLKHATRRKVRTALSVMIAAGFVIALSFMQITIQEDKERVEWLFDDTIVDGTIVLDPSVEQMNWRSISTTLLQRMLRLENIEHETVGNEDADVVEIEDAEKDSNRLIYSYVTETSHMVFITPLTEEEVEVVLQNNVEFFPDLPSANALGINSIEAYEEYHGVSISITFLEGFDRSIFSEPSDDKPVVFVSLDFMEQLAVNMGDNVRVATMQSEPQARNFDTYRIVGVFESDSPLLQVIAPLGHLQNQFGSLLYYDWLEFEINPGLNRQMDMVREEMGTLVANNDPAFILVLRDHVLRGVVEQLERNIAMMSMLYPVMLALSAFISAGLTVLLLLSVIRQVTIMRVLGMTKKRVIKGWVAEQSGLCIIGIGIGGIISLFAFGGVSLLGAVIYLFGCLIAGLVFMLILTKRNPLELLQMKE